MTAQRVQELSICAIVYEHPVLYSDDQLRPVRAEAQIFDCVALWIIFSLWDLFLPYKEYTTPVCPLKTQGCALMQDDTAKKKDVRLDCWSGHGMRGSSHVVLFSAL